MSTTTLPALGGVEKHAKAVADRIKALRNLTTATGTKTTRTQNNILQALPDEVLLRVAELLSIE